MTQSQYLPFFDIAHVQPAKTLFTAAKATVTVTVGPRLANTTAWAGDLEKLKLLRQKILRIHD